MKNIRVEQTSPVDDAPTRERVANSIMTEGPSTAVDLAQRLRLTPAAVRRHLDLLLADGVIEAREQRINGARGRGRPSKVFVVTDAGRDHFDQAYDDLASNALRYLQSTGGDAAVQAFARQSVVELEDRIRPLIQAAAPEDHAHVLAEALSQDGYAASAKNAPNGLQVCQHHCPVAHVAEEFPQLCEAEAEMFSRLLGSHVQRLATIAHGDGVCTTNIPHFSAAERAKT